MNYQRAFTLIELMIVIVIIGIISIIALPSYKQYVVDSKLAEAYSNMDALTKGQMAYFSDNSEFYSLDLNPAEIAPGMTIESNATWDQYGYAIAIGSNVMFSYSAHAGAYDESGTGIGVTDVSTAFIGINTPEGPCRDGTTPADLGAAVQNNYRFVVLQAQGDLDGKLVDDNCTVVLKLIQNDPAENRAPFSSGVVLLNKGS